MTEALAAAIDQAVQESTQPFATLDFDGTCIAHDVAEATLAYVCKNGLLKNEALLDVVGDPATYHERVFRRYDELLEASVREAYPFAARALAGFTPEEAERLVEAAIDAEGHELGRAELFGISIAHGLAARQKVREIARYLTERGVRVWVVTASPEVTVRVAMRYFGYTGRLIGLRNRVTNGVMTDVLEEPLSVQEGKVACIKRYIDSSARPVVAIGDSMNDLPMLEYARVPIVVDTGSALASLARERGWALV